MVGPEDILKKCPVCLRDNCKGSHIGHNFISIVNRIPWDVGDNPEHGSFGQHPVTPAVKEQNSVEGARLCPPDQPRPFHRESGGDGVVWLNPHVIGPFDKKLLWRGIRNDVSYSLPLLEPLWRGRGIPLSARLSSIAIVDAAHPDCGKSKKEERRKEEVHLNLNYSLHESADETAAERKRRAVKVQEHACTLFGM